MPVEEVGAGVGYDTFSSSMALNLRLVGNAGGEDENGSKAGSNEGCRVRKGRCGEGVFECESRRLDLVGDMSIMVNCGTKTAFVACQLCRQ